MPATPSLNRRRFLKVSAASGLALAAAALPSLRAVEAFGRAGAPRLLLSLAAYSFRDYFVDANHARSPQADGAKRIDMFQFIDYCAAQGCAGAEVTSYYFPRELTDEYLLKLRRHAFLRGVALSGTAVGNNFTWPLGEKREAEIARVKKWVDHASLLGTSHIRIFAGSPQGVAREEAVKLCLSAIEECAEYAGRKGVFLGLENHGGIVAEPEGILEIIRAVKSPWVGINLDTGNFRTADPYESLVLCAPYAVNVQLKGEIHRRGEKPERADLGRLANILREAHYQGYVALEYESAENPWDAVPVLLKSMKAAFAA